MSSRHFLRKNLKGFSKNTLHFNKDLKTVIDLLSVNPESGESIGNHCYKIRMSIASKNKGKSAGARIITHVKFVNEELFLISIYDKSELSNIAEDLLLDRIKRL